MLFTFYLFNRTGKCLYYKAWYRTRDTLADLPGEDMKLMFGAVLGLKDVAKTLSPDP